MSLDLFPKEPFQKTASHQDGSPSLSTPTEHPEALDSEAGSSGTIKLWTAEVQPRLHPCAERMQGSWVYFYLLVPCSFSLPRANTRCTHLLHHMEQAAEPKPRTSSDAFICTDTHKNFTRHQIITGRGQPPIRLSRSVLKWI